MRQTKKVKEAAAAAAKAQQAKELDAATQIKEAEAKFKELMGNKPRPPTVDLKSLYKKYEAETVTRKSKSKDKKYNAGDIRTNVDMIFAKLSVDRMSMSILHKLLIEVDAKFKELRYQEVRSVILSKKFSEYQLKTISEVSTAVKV